MKEEGSQKTEDRSQVEEGIQKTGDRRNTLLLPF
jgi:hypothetical protein